MPGSQVTGSEIECDTAASSILLVDKCCLKLLVMLATIHGAVLYACMQLLPGLLECYIVGECFNNRYKDELWKHQAGNEQHAGHACCCTTSINLHSKHAYSYYACIIPMSYFRPFILASDCNSKVKRDATIQGLLVVSCSGVKHEVIMG